MNFKKLAVLFLTVILVFGLLGGCQKKTTQNSNDNGENSGKPEVQLKLTPEEYPKVDGSTATIPLSEAFGAFVMNLNLEDARQYIKHNTTHDAYINLIDKKADIIFVTSPSTEELAYAKEKGVKLDVVPIVSEGFVFLTSKDNPVKDLSFKEIKAIYAGKITNWKEVGGKDLAIKAYQRPENSGSQTGMLNLVIGPDKIMAPPMEQIVAEMGALIDAVAAYDNEADAIGYSYYYFVTDMWNNKDVKLLAVDGVYPDAKTIGDGSYPIKTAYYAVLRKEEPKNSNARKLLAWILSEKGQQIAEEAGYVKLGK